MENDQDHQEDTVVVDGSVSPQPKHGLRRMLQAVNERLKVLPLVSRVNKLALVPLVLVVVVAAATLTSAAIFGPQNVMSHLPLSLINPSSTATNHETTTGGGSTTAGSGDTTTGPGGTAAGGGTTKGGGGHGNPGPCTHTGVSGSNGSYTFASLAVNAQGVVVDATNPSCTIHLAGLNQGWWTAETTGDPVKAKATMDFLTQHMHYNVIRVAFNSRWVLDNPPDPAYGGQLFRPAFDSFIQMAKQHGLYVELDLDSQFVQPPCDPKTPHCSKPSQGSIDWDDPNSKYFHDMKGEELSAYQPTATWALNYLATTYKNDPAILFNVWNEPASFETKMPIPNSNPPARGPISEDTFFKDMQDRVTAVTNVTQNHLTIVFVRALGDIMADPTHYPIFTQKNIMYDTHIYQSNYNIQQFNANVKFAQSHGQAFIVGEWGGAPGQPDPSTFLPLLRSGNINSTYFDGTTMLNNADHPTGLSSIGQAVDAQYQITFGQ